MMFVQKQFKDDATYLPVTMQQFEDLTNEILGAFNEVSAPQALDGNYMAQIVMAVIHSLDHKTGIVSKRDLFEGCVNLVSNHVTYHAVEEIQKKLKVENSSLDSADAGTEH